MISSLPFPISGLVMFFRQTEASLNTTREQQGNAFLLLWTSSSSFLNQMTNEAEHREEKRRREKHEHMAKCKLWLRPNEIYIYIISTYFLTLILPEPDVFVMCPVCIWDGKALTQLSASFFPLNLCLRFDHLTDHSPFQSCSSFIFFFLLFITDQWKKTHTHSGGPTEDSDDGEALLFWLVASLTDVSKEVFCLWE